MEPIPSDEVRRMELEEELRAARREKADYAMVIDLLGEIGKKLGYEQVVDKLLDTSRMLFSPGKTGFFPSEGEVRGDPDLEVPAVEGECARLPSGRGFALNLHGREGKLGTLVVDEVAHPERLDDYLNEGLAMARVGGLAMSNALIFERLSRSQEELRGLTESLRITNKIMRHEMRNQMTVVFGYLDLYQRSGKEDLLEKAVKGIERVQGLMAQMGELDRLLLSEEELTGRDLGEAVRAVSRGHRAEVTLEGEGTVLADQGLEVILENLIRNAEVHGGASRIEFHVRPRGSEVHLEVQDDGSGLPEGVDIFHEGISHGGSGGTGMGLFLVRRTLRRYGGTIETLPSEEGARFLLRFRNAER
ncbi:MAG: ATP-binding protein [Thermoplasmatota archaeon]